MARRRSLTRTSKRRARSLQGSISDRLRDAIEAERGNLLKVESLLGCLSNSMEYEQGSQTGTHYPDVAQVACDLVRQSIDGLDSLRLGRLISHRGVKEQFSALNDVLCLPSTPAASSRDLTNSDRCLTEAVLHTMSDKTDLVYPLLSQCGTGQMYFEALG